MTIRILLAVLCVTGVAGLSGASAERRARAGKGVTWPD
jgi:hypothetical protein